MTAGCTTGYWSFVLWTLLIILW